MGTRGLIGFVAKGEEKLTYNHFDSYPSRVGVDTLRWLREAIKEPEALLDRVLKLQLVEEGSAPTPEQKATLAQYADLGVSTQSDDDWYCLLRHTQGDPEEILQSGFIIDSHEFAKDSLFCEWAYVIDLDTMTFEVYKGFQERVPSAGRWAGHEIAEGREYRTQRWYPIQRVAAWPLQSLPSDDEFLAELREDDEDE